MAGSTDVEVREARLAELEPRTLYAILALRSEIFVVEQECVYLDLDGRDLEPAARQVWAEQDGHILATLRVLEDPDGTVRIGRVATRRDMRGGGLAALLMNRALALAGARAVVLNAQTYLLDWYAGFGFVRDGADYLDDGIPHVPMRRPPHLFQRGRRR